MDRSTSQIRRQRGRARAAIVSVAAIFSSVLGGAFLPSPADAINAKDALDRAKDVADAVGSDLAKATDSAKKKLASAKKQVQRGVDIARTVNRITKSSSPTTVPGHTPPPNQSVLVVPAGTYSVQETVLTFVDVTRPTEPTEKSPGAPSRTLETLIFTPKDTRLGQVFPLLVFAHGLGAKPKDYADLLRLLASAGYVVAAPRFPVGSLSAKTFAQHLDRIGTEVSQPADLSFVITQVIASSTHPGPLFGIVDASRISAIGHSLGATTVLDLTSNVCCVDSRVKSVVPISGFMNPFAKGAYFTGPAVPMLLIHGDKDKTVPFTIGSALIFASAGKPTALLTVIGGDHAFGIGGRKETRPLVGALVVSAMIDFLDQHLKGAADGLVRLRALVISQPAVLRIQE